jgi:ankyrin repeat protein
LEALVRKNDLGYTALHHAAAGGHLGQIPVNLGGG